MQLGYAITAHRCQGATMALDVILHVVGAFVPGLLRVMLSRVAQRKFLCIVSKLKPDHFH